MSLAAETRRAAGDHPFLVQALRAGICNYTAAARFLDVDGDTEAVATALRRYASDLPSFEATSREARVTMQSGVGVVGDGDESGDGSPDDGEKLLSVGATSLGSAGGDYTAVLATGEVDGRALAAMLERLATAGVEVTAAGVADGTATVVVGRRDGANALRAVERALESVPS